MEKIYLYSAVAWDCSRCGQENFWRLETKEFGSREEMEYYAEETGHDVDEMKTGDWLVVPDAVICYACGFEDRVKGYFSNAG